MSIREQFEAAVIERFKASGYLPVEIRTELLQRSGDDYYDGSISAYWYFWQTSRQALEIVLPDDGIADCERDWGARCKDTFDCGYNYASIQHEKAIEAAGVRAKP